MAVETPQHIIPDPRFGVETGFRPIRIGESLNVSLNISIDIPRLGNPVEAGMGVNTLLLLIIVSVLIIAAMLYYSSYRERALRRYHGEPFEKEWLSGVGRYRYTGLRRELRRLYEAILDILRVRGYSPPSGYTVAEVSSAARNIIGDWISWFAEVYNRYVFGVREPPVEVIERARENIDALRPHKE